MRFNSLGSAALGVGGGTISIDNQPIAQGGGCSYDGLNWCDDGAVVYNSAEGYVALWGSGAVFRAVSDPASPFYGWGANEVTGGGGQWQAWLNSPGHGLFTSAGLHLPLAGPPTSGPDGSFVVRTSYQSDGPYQVIEADGTSWDPGAWQGEDFHLLGHRRLVWREGAQIKTCGLPPPVRVSGMIWRPRAVHVQGVWWICYFSEHKGVVLHPFDSLEGYVVSGPTALAYRHDVFTDGLNIRVGWSVREGEQPGDYAYKDMDLALPRVPLEGSTTPVPPLPGPPSTTTMQIAAIPRKVWEAPFYSHSEQYGMTPMADHVGNAIWVGGKEGDPGALKRNLDLVRPLGQPMIVATDAPIDEANYNTTIAYWVSGANADALGQTTQRALGLPERPVIAYLDGDGWPTHRPVWVTDRVWPGVQAYRFKGETLAGFDARVTGVLAAVASYGVYMALTPRFDDFNGSQTVEAIVECMPLYSEWMRTWPMCVFMPFADRRGNGMAKVPVLREWAQAFMLANISRPNRFDYWFSETNSLDKVLENKLGQTVEMVVLTEKEKHYLLDAMAEAPTPPHPEPPNPEPPGDGYTPIREHQNIVADVFSRCTEEQRKTPVFVSEQVAYEMRRDGVIAHTFGGPTSAWCVNQKRGVQGDSEDAISVQHPNGAGGWAIIDVLAGFEAHVTGGTPAWTDVTQKTIDGGTVGGGRIPRNRL